MPIARRISLPAPLPTISGMTPAQKAIEVIRIGRSRRRQASIVASSVSLPCCFQVLGELDDQDRVLAGQPDQHHQRHLGEDVEVARLRERRQAATARRRTAPTGCTSARSGRSPAAGVQLSYCAASTRTTSTSDSTSTAARVGIAAPVPGRCDVAREPVLVGQLGPFVAHAARQRRQQASRSRPRPGRWKSPASARR